MYLIQEMTFTYEHLVFTASPAVLVGRGTLIHYKGDVKHIRTETSVIADISIVGSNTLSNLEKQEISQYRWI